MQDTLFRQWIEAGYRNYGQDPWFFLRELAQNSRDAGARTVRVSVNQSDREREILTFLDDGMGMNFDHARQFLFRLYASSKTNEKYSAGMYGIGFWTILRYQPDLIIIESRTGSGAWSIEIDSGFRIRHISCNLHQKGTRITLIRKSQSPGSEQFASLVKERTIHYCGYLRRNDHQASPLPVFFEQDIISRDFQLQMVFGARFKQGPVEGLVGFDHQPRVILYARGLPVWEGTRLDELFHLPPETESESEIGPGLAPVFLINGNHLDVNISRKTIMENRALEKVKKIAEKEMSDLIDRYANRAYPHRWYQKLKIRLKRLTAKWKPRFWMMLFTVLIFLIPLEIVVLKTLFPTLPASKKVSIPPVNSFLRTEGWPYSGATVLPFSQPRPLDMIYSPSKDIWFKVFTADTYDLKQGFIRSGNQPAFNPPGDLTCLSETISIHLKIPGNGSLFLPRPIGHTILPNSLTINGIPFRGIKLTPGGEMTINLSNPNGDIRYSCCRVSDNASSSVSVPGEWTRLPGGIIFPDGLNPILEEAAKHDIDGRIQLAIDLTVNNMVYDTSAQTARAFQQAGNDLSWLKKVLNIGRGDCDIINGLTVLWMRKMGIPARLVIGLVGIRGSIQDSLHAWTEYQHQGWRILDTSRMVKKSAHPIMRHTSPESISPPITDSHRLWIYLLATILICLIPILLLGLKKRHGQTPVNDQDHPDMKSNLARMAIGALLQPRLWSVQSNFREYRIIPTIKGPAISLNGIIDLARRGKLLAGDPANPLSERFINQGHPVLNLEEGTYSGLIRLVPGVIDLNLIRDLRAGESEGIGIPAQLEFLEHINRTMKAIKRSLPICLISPGLVHREMQHVKFPKILITPGAILRFLSPMKRSKKNRLPGQFMAINPRSQRILDLTRLYSENPPLARFRLIKGIIGQIGLPKSQKTALLKKVSQHVLREDTLP